MNIYSKKIIFKIKEDALFTEDIKKERKKTILI